MKNDPKKRRALKVLLECAEQYFARGAGHPDDIQAIETDYLHMLNRVERMLDLDITEELK